MVMDFWAAQRKARSRTKLYVFIFTILTIAVATSAEFAMRAFVDPKAYDPPVPLVGLVFMATTFLVAGYNYLLYKSQGGSYVAESVGARLVDPMTPNFKEKQLLNIVEEMAVAAGIRVPPVYILEDTSQINAFAAGMSLDNAAVTITRGAMERLKRDELQGVIAHELGHVRNGDMQISMQLAAMVMGFFFVLYIALRIAQFSSLTDSREEKRGGNPLVIAALILVIAGSFMWLAGSILKACVSREREYLADASAVQFTRDPNGIANALRKLLYLEQKGKEENDMPKSGMAFSHMYFNDFSFFSMLFATHPSLEKRISALEGRTYIPEEWDIPPESRG